uniref:Uncharacterized protein n=1 Tax=Rhizophora mucronata TaxID=61149 RepID=A0A2P2IR87_RHIMU
MVLHLGLKGFGEAKRIKRKEQPKPLFIELPCGDLSSSCRWLYVYKKHFWGIILMLITKEWQNAYLYTFFTNCIHI